MRNPFLPILPCFLLASAGLALDSIPFEPATDLPLGGRPSAVVRGDFNRDGRADLAVLDSDTDGVRVLLNRPSGASGGPIGDFPLEIPGRWTASRARLDGSGESPFYPAAIEVRGG